MCSVTGYAIFFSRHCGLSRYSLHFDPALFFVFLDELKTFVRKKVTRFSETRDSLDSRIPQSQQKFRGARSRSLDKIGASDPLEIYEYWMENLANTNNIEKMMCV